VPWYIYFIAPIILRTFDNRCLCGVCGNPLRFSIDCAGVAKHGAAPFCFFNDLIFNRLCWSSRAWCGSLEGNFLLFFSLYILKSPRCSDFIQPFRAQFLKSQRQSGFFVLYKKVPYAVTLLYKVTGKRTFVNIQWKQRLYIKNKNLTIQPPSAFTIKSLHRGLLFIFNEKKGLYSNKKKPT
jgi:hypothetical protein